MTFQDIFKSGFLENAQAVALPDMAVALLLSLAMGLFLFFIYKRTCSGVMYSASFGLTLVALCMITTLLILTVVSNVVLSLGMVGALSIVRFRTAIKEPLDIVFLFWAIACGIVLAAGLIPLAVFGGILIGLVLLLFSAQKTADFPYILVLHCEGADAEELARSFLLSQVRRLNLKSKSIEDGRIELSYELRLRGCDSSFLSELEAMPGIHHLVLVSYNGDYMG